MEREEEKLEELFRQKKSFFQLFKKRKYVEFFYYYFFLSFISFHLNFIISRFHIFFAQFSDKKKRHTCLVKALEKLIVRLR